MSRVNEILREESKLYGSNPEFSRAQAQRVGWAPEDLVLKWAGDALGLPFVVHNLEIADRLNPEEKIAALAAAYENAADGEEQMAEAVEREGDSSEARLYSRNAKRFRERAGELKGSIC